MPANQATLDSEDFHPAYKALYRYGEALNEDHDRVRRALGLITALSNGGDQSNWRSVADALKLAETALRQTCDHILWLQREETRAKFALESAADN